MSRFSIVSFSLALLVLMSGCNVFDGLEKEGASDDPELLLQDAEIAIARGEAERAEQYLRRARALDPDNALVNIKLSSALLAKHRLGAMDLIRMARSLNGSRKLTPTSSALTSNALRLQPGFASAVRPPSACSFDSTAVGGFERFEPSNIERFNEFQPADSALTEIRGLIGDVFATTDSSVEDFDGRDIQAVVDSLRASGLTDQEIAEAAINDAVATATLVYIDLSQEARNSYAYYYVYPDAAQDRANAYLGYCADTEALLDEAEQVVSCNQPDLRYTRDLLSTRADLLPSSSIASDVAAEASDAYTALYQQDIAACNTAASNLRIATR